MRSFERRRLVRQPFPDDIERERVVIDLSVSTLADQVGAGVFALLPLYRLIETHVLGGERLHGSWPRARP